MKTYRIARWVDRFSISIRATWLLCGLVFLVSLVLALVGGNTLRYPDEYEYHQLATHLAQGQGYVMTEGRPTAFRPPGYAFVLAPVYRIWPQPITAKVLNACMLAGTALALAALAGTLSPRARPFAPLMILLYPVLLYEATTLYPQTLAVLLLVCAILVLFRHPRSPRYLVGAGLLFGALILTVPLFLVMLPIVAVYVAWGHGQSARGRWRVTAAFVLGAFLLVTPWTIRNAIMMRAFIPVSTNAGLNLLLGNSEYARPDSGVNVDIERYQAETVDMTETETDRHYRRRAIEWMRRNPLRATMLYLRKVANHFNFSNELFVRSEMRPERWAVLFITYYGLLTLAVTRLFRVRAFPLARGEVLMLGLYLGAALVYAVFFTRIRFRLPLDALLIAFNAVFVGRLIGRWAYDRPEGGRTPGMYCKSDPDAL